MNFEWTSKHPKKTELKKDIAAMSRAYVKTLLKFCPKGSIVGIYLKGSANKQWDSLLDYVPEISDLDIHFLLADKFNADNFFGDFTMIKNMQLGVENLFYTYRRHPVHIPRPQLLTLNSFKNDPNYQPDPKSMVKVLFGKPYSTRHTVVNQHVIKQNDCDELIANGNSVKRLPLNILDKPDKYNLIILRQISWRISIIGPKCLYLNGYGMQNSWSINRTQIVKALREHNLYTLADEYAKFYLKSWDYYLSGFTDSKIALEALECGINAIKIGAATAQSWLDAQKLAKKL